MSTQRLSSPDYGRDRLFPTPSKTSCSRPPPPTCVFTAKIGSRNVKAQKEVCPICSHKKPCRKPGIVLMNRSREKSTNAFARSSSLLLRSLAAATASSSAASAHSSSTAPTAAVAAISSPAATVSAAPLCLRRRLLLFHNVDDLVGDAEVFDLCVRAGVLAIVVGFLL
jgi:hypothetical protein